MNEPTLTVLAVATPDHIMTNAEIIATVPEAVADAADGALARAFRPDAPARRVPREVRIFDRARLNHAHDPFQGSVERRVVGPHETSVELGQRAAEHALAAGGWTGADIDLLISVAAPPERIFPGDAAELAARLGVAGTAFNVENFNASWLVGVRIAFGLLASGAYQRGLVIGAAVYSRLSDLTDSFSWFVGDGATAAIIDSDNQSGARLRGDSIRTNHGGRDVFELVTSREDSRNRLHIRPTARVRTDLVPSTLRSLRATSHEALEAAGVPLRQLDLHVLYASTGFMGATWADVIGTPPERSIDVHRWFANVGPVIPALGAHLAAATGRLRPGQSVLLNAVGPDSCAASLVLEWGQVRLGPLPAGLTWEEHLRAS